MAEVIDRIGIGSPENIVRGRPIDFGNGVTVVPDGITHSPEYYTAHKEEIKRVIAASDFVVSENDPILANYFINTDARDITIDQSSIEFYNRLLSEVWRQKKVLVYVDPASATQTNLEEDLRSFGGLVMTFGSALSAGRKAVRHELTRRQFLRRTGLFLGGLTLAGTSWSGENKIRSVLQLNEQDNPLSNWTYRNAGAVFSLGLLAERGLIHGAGNYFVGETHVPQYERFGGNLQYAKDTYHQNVNTLFPQGSELGPSPIRIWLPSEKNNTFILINIVNRP